VVIILHFIGLVLVHSIWKLNPQMAIRFYSVNFFLHYVSVKSYCVWWFFCWNSETKCLWCVSDWFILLFLYSALKFWKLFKYKSAQYSITDWNKKQRIMFDRSWTH